MYFKTSCLVSGYCFISWALLFPTFLCASDPFQGMSPQENFITRWNCMSVVPREGDEASCQNIYYKEHKAFFQKIYCKKTNWNLLHVTNFIVDAHQGAVEVFDSLGLKHHSFTSHLALHPVSSIVSLQCHFVYNDTFRTVITNNQFSHHLLQRTLLSVIPEGTSSSEGEVIETSKGDLETSYDYVLFDSVEAIAPRVAKTLEGEETHPSNQLYPVPLIVPFPPIIPAVLVSVLVSRAASHALSVASPLVSEVEASNVLSFFHQVLDLLFHQVQDWNQVPFQHQEVQLQMFNPKIKEAISFHSLHKHLHNICSSLPHFYVLFQLLRALKVSVFIFAKKKLKTSLIERLS